MRDMMSVILEDVLDEELDEELECVWKIKSIQNICS